MIPAKPTPRTVLCLIAQVFLLLSIPCPAQTPVARQPKNPLQPSMDIALGVSGELTEDRTPMVRSSLAGAYVAQKTQSVDASAGALMTFHQRIKPWLGYTVSAGYTRSTHNYSYTDGFINNPNAPGEAQYAQGSIEADRYDLTIGYVVEGPRTSRFRSFYQAGGGGLFFVPASSYFANQQTRPALLFGVGMDYAVTTHVGVRAEYRGLFYKGPDFAYDFGNVPVQRLFTITSSPTLGVVYRFSGSPKCHCDVKAR